MTEELIEKLTRDDEITSLNLILDPSRYDGKMVVIEHDNGDTVTVPLDCSDEDVLVALKQSRIDTLGRQINYHEGMARALKQQLDHMTEAHG